MSKLYVPDGAWLVCSKGMKKQQIAVTSQNKVTMAGSHLKATIEDRPGGNFVCGAMAVAGAIIGAVVGAAFVIGTVASGGALALGAGATMAACAAGGAAAGGLASLIPSICGMLLYQWAPYDKDVLTAKIPPLLDNSEISCRLGGTVIILYSEKAADEMTDVIIGDTAIGVVGTIAVAYIVGPAMSALGSTAGAAYATYQTFGAYALGNYIAGVSITAGTAYAMNETVNAGKGWAYNHIPVPGTDRMYGDYVDGFETDVVKLKEVGLQQNPSDAPKAPEDYANDIGGATDIGRETVGNRQSQYVTQERSSSVRLDDIEEHGPTTRTQSGRIDGAIEGKNPIAQSSTQVTKQDYGGRYQEVTRNSTTINSQYRPLNTYENLQNIRKSASNFFQDQKSKPRFGTEGPQGGGFYFGLLQDVAKAISNFLLEGQAKDVIEALEKAEIEARVKINVLAGND